MEFVERFNNLNNKYTDKIKDSKYTEGKKLTLTKKGFDDICEIIISNVESDYLIKNNEEKTDYVKTIKLKIASMDNYDKNKYITKFSKNLISRGLQVVNSFSSILYLNDYYKVNLVIFNSKTNKYFKTGYNNNFIYCEYKNNSWFQKEISSSDIEYSDINLNKEELTNILNFDINTNLIYKTDILPIGKYKIDELRDLAKQLNIELKDEKNKNKSKKILYDEVNLKKTLNLI